MTDDLLSDWADVGYPHVELVDPPPPQPACPEWEVCLFDLNDTPTPRVRVQPILDGLKIRISGVVFEEVPTGTYETYGVYYQGTLWKKHSMNRVSASPMDQIRIGIVLNF